VSRATLQRTAALVAELCRRHKIPAVRLTVAQTRAAYYAAASSRPKGINDHATVTAAYPEDNGTHTDLGPEFPWDVFMQMVTEDSMSEMFPTFGDTGEGVKRRQRQLVRLGRPGVGAIDGLYDAELVAVVKAYRAQYLAADQVGSGKTITGWMVDHMEWAEAVKAAETHGTPGPKGDTGPTGPQGPQGVAAVLMPGSTLIVQ
jgi:N-acetyl-anhydromuramyl-L-alanine amidase AmpD